MGDTSHPVLWAHDADQWLHADPKPGEWPSRPPADDPARGWLDRAFQGGEALAGPADALNTPQQPGLGNAVRSLYQLVRQEHRATPGAALIGVPLVRAPKLHRCLAAHVTAVLLLPGRRGRIYMLPHREALGKQAISAAAQVAVAVVAAAHSLFSVEVVQFYHTSSPVVNVDYNRNTFMEDWLTEARKNVRKAAHRHFSARTPRATGERVKLPACEVEFVDGGNTLWVHAPDGSTILRIKTRGRFTRSDCSSPSAHADINAVGNVSVCVPPTTDQEV